MKNDKKYKADEIVDYLKKIGYSNIDKTIITSTDPDTIKELYSSLLDKIGVTKKQNYGVNFSVFKQERFQYPGLHDKVINYLSVSYYMEKFLSKVLKYDDFTSSDIFEPNPKQTQIILSKIINFLKFRETETEYYQKIKTQNDESRAKLEQIKQQLLKSKEDVNIALHNKEIVLQETQKIESKIQSYKEQYNSQKEKLNSAKIQYDSLTKSIDDVKKEIKNEEQLQVTYNNNITYWRSQLVSSPEKVQSLLQEAQNTMNQLNREIEEGQKKVIELDKVNSNLDVIESKVKEFCSAVDEFEKFQKIDMELKRKIATKEEEIERKTKELGQNDYKVETVQSKITQLNKYINENVQKIQDDKKEKEMELEELNKRCIELNAKQETLRKELQFVTQNTIGIQDGIKELDIIVEEHGKKIENEMNGLFANVKDYTVKFAKLLEEYNGD